MDYRCDEYLPNVKRFEAFGPIADPSLYDGILAATFTALADRLKASLGKPKVKRKQRVEFEWGGHSSSPEWGGVYLLLDSSDELKIGGGDSAPWRHVSLVIHLMGTPRP